MRSKTGTKAHFEAFVLQVRSNIIFANMPTLHIPIEQLFDMVVQLPPDELGRFMHRHTVFQARIREQVRKEAHLVDEIRQIIPPIWLAEANKYAQKSVNGDLTEAEQQAWQALNQNIEALNVERVRKIIALAALREQPVAELMEEFALTPPPVIVPEHV